MEPASGVGDDVATTTRHRWRGALLGAGIVVAAGLLTLLAPSSAHADENPGPLGGLVNGTAGLVGETVPAAAPLTALPLPSSVDAPVVGEITRRILDTRPVTALTDPVTALVDGAIGSPVGSLPIVGGVLGDRPLGQLVNPLPAVLDEVVGGALGTVAAGPAVVAPVVGGHAGAFATGARAASALVHAATPASIVAASAVLPDNPAAPLPVGDDAAVPATPASVGASGAPPGGSAATVIGIGLLLLLVGARMRRPRLLAPLSPVFATDTSPD